MREDVRVEWGEERQITRGRQCKAALSAHKSLECFLIVRVGLAVEGAQHRQIRDWLDGARRDSQTSAVGRYDLLDEMTTGENHHAVRAPGDAMRCGDDESLVAARDEHALTTES